ncbi:MAG: CopD family protein [Pseudomonadota bacterium]|nr:CopD family protein [Pseudomonadota bacterium]
MIDPLDIVRAVATLTAAIVIGCGVLNWYTRDAHVTKGGAIWRTRAAGLILAAAGIGVIATALGAIGASAAAVAAADSHAFSFNGPVLETYLMQTGVGHISILQFGSAVVACMLAGLAWVTLKKTPASDLLLLTAALAAGFGQAVVPFASHPTTLDPRWIGLAAAIAHRLALSVWLGGLPALILLIGVGLIAEDTRHFAGGILRHFSRVATVAMVVILATGGILTWYLVGNVSSLIATVYGNLLIVKLTLLGGVLLIANSLQRQLLPALEMKPSDSTILSYARRVKVETLLAVLIVIVASDMAGLSPPEHEDAVWPLHFRFSLAATLGPATPWWIWTLVLAGSALILAGLVLIALVIWPSLRPARLRPDLVLGVGVAASVAGCALAMPAISVPAFPSTYLTTDIPYAATSITDGLNRFEQNCTGCHGVSGHGDGPAASSLPVKPADLSAPHTALHTGGDLYWWVTHGIPASGMPGYGDLLTNDERWDIINFLGAFSVGYQARVIEPKINRGQYWLAPPDFQVTDENGNTGVLSDYRRKSAILLLLFSCTQENVAQETARFEQLLAAREPLAGLGAKIILVAPGKICKPLRALATGKVLVADRDTADVATTYGLYTRSFHNRKQDVVRVPDAHVEFLIDRSGYIRARWLPEEDNSWSDPGFIETQLEMLAREPPAPPPPDVHAH